MIDEIYNAIEETHCSLQQLSDNELIECREVLANRLEKVLLALQKKEEK
jgi:hypothetical protein